jgi:hypothetical protein
MAGRAGEGFIAQAYESANHVIGVGPFLALSLWNKETTQPGAERRWPFVT